MKFKRSATKNTEDAVLSVRCLKIVAHRLLREKFDRGLILNSPSANDRFEPKDVIDEINESTLETLFTPSELQTVTDEINSWQRKSGMGAYLKEAGKLEELARRCEKLPPVETVEKHLGASAAERYRENLHLLQDNSVLGVQGEVDQSVRNRWTKDRVVNVVRLVSIASLPTHEEIAAEYAALLDKARRRERETRRCKLVNNEPIAKAVKATGLWLPFPEDVSAKWSKKILPSSLAIEFCQLAQQVHDRLGKVRRVLQFVRRRRCCKEAIDDVQKNMVTMRHILAYINV
eukprot:TRINITY_DN110_c0_g3_i1.p1 TRINITY_DN110_c0_g3~~TRINITY_DN110_c0_g3_i1.p1  ORF type:complete len:289 (-),score=30.07 TRINITY_DN110_c0_g3_i1:193-1059(-)